jgi:hypothetical protein
VSGAMEWPLMQGRNRQVLLFAFCRIMQCPISALSKRSRGFHVNLTASSGPFSSELSNSLPNSRGHCGKGCEMEHETSEHRILPPKVDGENCEHDKLTTDGNDGNFRMLMVKRPPLSKQ